MHVLKLRQHITIHFLEPLYVLLALTMIYQVVISSFVKGYHECKYVVTKGEFFFIQKIDGPYGRAFRVKDGRGVLGHLEQNIANILVNFEDISLTW